MWNNPWGFGTVTGQLLPEDTSADEAVELPDAPHSILRDGVVLLLAQMTSRYLDG